MVIKENRNNKIKLQKDQKKTLEKSGSIMKYELLLFEFTDILTSFLVKKHKDLHTNKDDEFKNRMLNHIKDVQKEQLKIQQEIKAKQRKLLEEERKQEEREKSYGFGRQ